jgi:hypothetical protein
MNYFVYHLPLVFLLSISSLFAQTEYISAKVEGLDLYYTEAGCVDCLLSPDPRWRTNVLMQGASAPTFAWDKDVQDMGTCGWKGFTNPTWVPLQTNLPAAAFLMLDFDGWEAEGFGCGATDAACGGYSIIYNIIMRDSTPCQWHTFVASRTCTSDGITGTYQVKGRFYWQYSALKGGTIAAAQTICSGGDPALLTSTVAGSTHGTYQWQDSLAGGTWQNISGANSATYDPPILTITKYYRRKISVNCSGTLTAYSNIIAITVTPINDISITGLSSVCSGTIQNLIATVTGGSTCTIQWQKSTTGAAPWTNMGTNSTTLSSGTQTLATTYRAYRTCTNLGCGADTSNLFAVSVIPKPATPTGINVSRCGTGSVSVSVSGCAAGTIDWYDASTNGNFLGTGTPFNISALAATTTYYAECTISGCKSTRKAIIATVNPAISVNAGTDKTICQGQSVGLQAIASGGTGTITYSWTNGAGTSATPTVSPASSLTYIVTAKDGVNCTATDNVMVSVYPTSTAGAAFVNVNTAYNSPVANVGAYPVHNYCATSLNFLARNSNHTAENGGQMFTNALCASGLSVEDNPIFLVTDINVNGNLSVSIPQNASGTISHIEMGLYGPLPSSGLLVLPLSVAQLTCEEVLNLHSTALSFTAPIATTGKYLLVADTEGDKGSFVINLNFNSLPLSADFRSFEGKIKENTDFLSWKTTKEVNVDFFEIEKMAENGTFISLGKIAAKGNSNVLNEYVFVNEKPQQGKNTYRLSVRDIDGNSNFAQNLVELYHNAAFTIQLYPNPAKQEIALAWQNTNSADAEIHFLLYNTFGQQVQNKQLLLEMGKEARISLAALPSGTYFYRVFGENGSQNGKIVKE